MLPTIDLLGDQLVQLPESPLGILAKELRQIPAVQDVLTEEAGRARVQRTMGQLASDRTRGHPADAHRWSTRHQEEGGAGDEAHAPQEGAGPWPGPPLYFPSHPSRGLRPKELLRLHPTPPLLA